MLQAIIDIGSNTLRMIIYKIENGKAEQIIKKKHLVGLAAFLKDGIMTQGGIDRVTEVLTEYKSFLKSFEIENVSAFTTAALRNAKNSSEAVGEITERTGIDIKVISGAEEAEYDFIGAVHNLSEKDGLLIDIGGASTELVYFKNRKIMKKESLLIGSLSLHSKFSSDILPTWSEIEKMRRETEDVFTMAIDFQKIRHAHICGIGGTFKGALALSNRIFGCEKDNMDIKTADLEKLVGLFHKDREITEAELISLLQTCSDRLHTIIPGIVIADVLAGHFGSEIITYSDNGVREGYIYKELLK